MNVQEVDRGSTRSPCLENFLWKGLSTCCTTNNSLNEWMNEWSQRNMCLKLIAMGQHILDRLLLKCDGTRTETTFRLSAKRTSPFKSAGASVPSTTGSRSVRISGSNAGYTMFQGSVKSTGYALHSPVSPSLPLPYVTVCHHISSGLYEIVT